jgi:hypothetical protein
MLPKKTMWGRILFFPYEDYKLDSNRKSVLKILAENLIANLSDVVMENTNNIFSSAWGVHVTGTEDQAASPIWHSLRAVRISGTTFKNFSGNPSRMAAKMWDEKSDLSNLKSIRWGQEHESVAREEYERLTGSVVDQCGLFVSRKNPIFCATPDGLIQNRQGLLEIKCPYSLRDEDLLKLNCEKLSSSQCFKMENGKPFLKKSHTYFNQIQLGMYCTGCLYTDFVM